jgi:hypothetical protein
VSTELDRKVEALTTSIHALATELREKEVPQDRITSIEAEIEVKSSQIDDLLAEKRNKEVDTKLAELDERLKSFNQAQARTKAAAILAGVSDQTRAAAIKAVGQYTETSFLKALVNRRSGDQDAQEFVKSVLGTSDATGQAVVPNNFVAGLVDQLALNNPYRELFDVVTGVRGAAVDIPYSITGITAALLQGAYGSNKDVRDFSFNQATATLYTIAQIADVGNQLLRQSEGAAEKSVRNRLGKSIGMLEAPTSRTARAAPSRSASSPRWASSVTRPASRRRSPRSRVWLSSPAASRRWRVVASTGPTSSSSATRPTTGKRPPRASARRMPVAGPSIRPAARPPTRRSPRRGAFPCGPTRTGRRPRRAPGC